MKRKYSVGQVRPVFLYAEFENYPTELLERMHENVLDRWTWDTGSEEDQHLIQRLVEEMDFRRRQKAAMEAIQSTVQVITEQQVQDLYKRLLTGVGTLDEVRKSNGVDKDDATTLGIIDITCA